MANKTLFKSLIGKLIPATDAINEEHAPAYALFAKASTGAVRGHGLSERNLLRQCRRATDEGARTVRGCRG